VLNNKLGDYDTLIIGTPIWAGSMCPPLRAFIEKYKNEVRNVVFFSTSCSGNAEKIFCEMQEIIHKQPLGSLSFRTKEVKDNTFTQQVKKFIQDLEG